MDSHKVCFITCVNHEEWYEECRLYLEHLEIPEGMQTEYIAIRGASSMAAGYNKAMCQSDARYKVYLHQDTLLVKKDFIRAIQNIFNDDSIGALGVIGCKNLPASGIWWDGMRTFGRVLHACEAESVVDSELREPRGEYALVEAVDGLLIATQYDIFWREDILEGFHFYDTAQCLEFKRHGYRVVVPKQSDGFWCIHCPREKALAPEYKEYQKIFLREYGEELHPEV